MKGTSVVSMQPPEPATGPASQPPVMRPAGGGAVAAPKRLKDRRVRLFLAVGLGIVLLLCLGGVGVIVSLYDSATAIKRTAPDAVVDSFLRAYLVNRDDKAAALYECKSGGSFVQLAAFRADIVTREKQYTIGIRVSWTDLVVEERGGQTTVTTDIRRAITDGSERTSDPWRFQMVDDAGWRVCGATKLTS